MKETELKDLVGRNLDGYEIVVMTEVFPQNEDGIKSSTFGFFKNPDIAKAFAENTNGGGWSNGTQERLVLTNGKIGFVLDSEEQVKLFDDEEEALKLKQSIAKKLSPAEQKLMQL